ncbi:MAG: energy transducer TonB, partial [Bacteroidota bacterium]
MFVDKHRYAFLSRMRRPEGLPPRFEKNFRLHLGTSPARVYEISFIISLTLVIAGLKFLPVQGTKRTLVVQRQELVSVEDIEITRQEERPPMPPKPPVVIEAMPDEVLGDVSLGSSEIDITQTLAPPAPQPSEGDDEEYFIAVEEIPQLVDGITGLMKHVVYPDLAIRAGIQGRVYVLVYVNEVGDVVRAELLRGIGAGCDEAALAALKKAKFIPGKQRGKPVKT